MMPGTPSAKNDNGSMHGVNKSHAIMFSDCQTTMQEVSILMLSNTVNRAQTH